MQEECGILLDDNKAYLVESRLKNILKSHSIKNVNELVEEMSNTLGKRLRDEVIDAMTTNETSWFRDSKPFDYLKSVILKDLRDRSRRIRLGSFACSSGQEPYSMSMSVNEFKRVFPGSFHDGVTIVAVDISQEMLAKGMKGIYSASEVAHGLSAERKQVFFHKDKNNDYHVVDDVKDIVRFQQLNMLNSFILLGKFDVIFCRNVLFYFEPKTREKIIEKLYQSLNPGGYLVLGGPESLGQYLSSDKEELLSLFDTHNNDLGQFYQKKD